MIDYWLCKERSASVVHSSLTSSVCLFLDVDPYLSDRQYRPEPERKASYGEDMRRVRLEQQEIANKRAIEAAKQRKIKREADKARKNQAALKPNQTEGTRLGGPSSNSYNPLQPSSSSSGGGGYKPAKRSVGRS